MIPWDVVDKGLKNFQPFRMGKQNIVIKGIHHMLTNGVALETHAAARIISFRAPTIFVLSCRWYIPNNIPTG
jgi:hypothetical protein